MIISLFEDAKVAVLRTQTSCYAMSWSGEHGTPLRHLHWGPPLTDADLLALAAADPHWRRPGSADNYPRAMVEEYPVDGGQQREAPALIVGTDGSGRGLLLEVTSVTRDTESLVVVLGDPGRAVEVRLRYRVESRSDAIIRSAVIVNNGSAPIVVSRACSASWPVPRRADKRMWTATGLYAMETHLREERVPIGTYALESRAGFPGHDAFPVMAFADHATENAGSVWSVALAWSGSWRLESHLAADGAHHVLGGLHDTEFPVDLRAGDSMELPAMVGIHSPAGLGGMTHRWHDYQRTVVPRPTERRPVIFNAWEASNFEVEIEQQLRLAGLAADLGAELFVIDDGWFGSRVDNSSGLGDWYPNPAKFPDDSMELLSRTVHRLGMQFGLWVEPEMVNEDSQVYRAHPEWVLRRPGRQWNPGPEYSNRATLQHVLDFSNVEVQDWAAATLSSLITRYHLDCLKWDMNRPITESATIDRPATAEFWREYVTGLHRVWDLLRERHPLLWIETCASGGGRADLSSLSRTHWAWPSDDVFPVERIEIQRGFSAFNLPMVMACWVTDPPAAAHRASSLRFRFHVAMSGVLGISAGIDNWAADELAEARELVALYRDVADVIQFGRLHRCPSPEIGTISVSSYVSADQRRAVVIVLAAVADLRADARPIRIDGLDDGQCYRLRDTVSGCAVEFSGASLRHHGVLVELSGYCVSTVLVLDAIDAVDAGAVAPA